jgi:hypothetical protein
VPNIWIVNYRKRLGKCKNTKVQKQISHSLILYHFIVVSSLMVISQSNSDNSAYSWSVPERNNVLQRYRTHAIVGIRTRLYGTPPAMIWLSPSITRRHFLKHKNTFGNSADVGAGSSYPEPLYRGLCNVCAALSASCGWFLRKALWCFCLGVCFFGGVVGWGVVFVFFFLF